MEGEDTEMFYDKELNLDEEGEILDAENDQDGIYFTLKL